MLRRISPMLLRIVLVLGLACILGARPNRGKRYRRAAPPAFDRSAVARIFFGDLFAEALIGQRPQNLSSTTSSKSPKNRSDVPTENGATDRGYAWSKHISGETIEDEIKAIKASVDRTVTTPAKFKGGGYSDARNDFSVLAAMFAMINEYDGEVRWQGSAPVARDLLAKAGINCKAGTDLSFREARLRKQDLQDLIGGGSLSAIEPAVTQNDWSSICERSPIMVRLDGAINERLLPWTANVAEMKTQRAKIIHEAEIVAALTAVLEREGMDDADDSDYTAFCDIILKESAAIVSAAKDGDNDRAQSALGRINIACDDCHEDYR